MLKLLFTLFTSGLILSACGPADMLTELSSNSWNVSSLNGKSLESENTTKGLPFLTFSDNGKLFGSTGCNNFTGSYKLTGTKLDLNLGALTKMMCPGDTEQNFINTIKKVTNIKMDGGTLNLFNGTKSIMTLIPKSN